MNPDPILERIRAQNERKASDTLAHQKHQEMLLNGIQTQETILKAFQSLISYMDQKTTKTEVVNQLKEIGTPDALKVADAVNDLHETLKTHENTDLSEITDIMKSVLREAQAIPKEIPSVEIPETVTVKNQVDYSAELRDLLKAIKAIKLVAEAPVVNVPAPEVSVAAPDLKPISKELQAVKKAVEGIIIPEHKTDNSDLVKLLKQTNKLLNELLDKPMGASGGGGVTSPYRSVDDLVMFPTVVESTDNPGVFGIVILNPDGSTVSAGGGGTTPAVDNLIMETGDNLLLETGDLILTE